MWYGQCFCHTSHTITQVLLTNSSLTKLVIRRSGLATSGAASVAAALRVHPQLSELDLMDNAEVGDDGVSHLAGGLAVSKALRRLVLWNTGMGDKGAWALGEALSTIAGAGGSKGCCLQVCAGGQRGDKRAAASSVCTGSEGGRAIYQLL